MGDKSVKDRDWSGAIGQAARQPSEELRKVLKEAEETKKISELANKQAVRPILKNKK